ncbi:MAG: hypothetical protein M5E90_01100 [Asgard group archaeon]|nr:hypothetical protein [Asgard group archaeon]
MSRSTTTVMTSTMPSQSDEYTPSHPNFDRSQLSDSQYIEQLIFENRELQTTIDKQNTHIANLKKQLETLRHLHQQQQQQQSPRIQTSQPTLLSSSNSSPSPIAKSPTSPQRLVPKSPKRPTPLSPRPLRSNQNANSFALATPVDDRFLKDQIHEPRPSPSQPPPPLPSTSPPPPLQQKSEQPAQDDDDNNIDNNNDDNKEVVVVVEEEVHEIPIRSSRRRRNSLDTKSTADKKASYISVESSIASQIPNSISNNSGLSSNKGRDEDNEDEFLNKTADNSYSMKSGNADYDISGNRGIRKSATHTTLNTMESIDSNRMDESQFSTLDSAKSHTETSSATAASARIYTQGKTIARSSSSVGSTYKSSRIKPPGLQKKPSDTSIVDLAPPTSLKVAVANLGSPVESRSPQSQYDTPPSQSSSTFSNNNNIDNQLDPPYELTNQDVVTSSTTLTGMTSSHATPTPVSRPPTLNLPTQQPYISPHGVSTPVTQQLPYENVTPRPSLHSPAGSATNIPQTPQTPGSSFNIIHTPKTDMDESTLFIKPDEFHTIFISVVSTITVNSMNQAAKKSDDPNITITINDRETKKEMWKIRKTISQLGAFDQEIRPILEYFGLPPLPDKQSFFTSTPAKIETRRSAMQSYFNSIFVMPHIPKMVLYNICKFLSLDFVNPLDDFKSGARKEGFLVRRYKGLGTNWKIRWCQVDGPYMEIYENPGGPMLEQIKLSGAQIGRQSTDSVAEDKGYRHAFLVMESQSSKKLHSSIPKHFFCAETDEERDDWVTSLIEFTEGSPESSEPSSPQRLGNGRDENIDNLLTPNTKVEIGNDELKSINNGLTPASIAASFADSISNFSTTIINEDITKKPKKRSIFPFRNRANTTDSDASLATACQQLQPPHNTSTEENSFHSMPSTPQEDLQQVLDKMNLGEEVIPKSVFGKDIHAAFELSNHSYHGKQIPSICFRCLDFLERTHAIYEEGIFRISGRKAVITELQQQFDRNLDVDLFTKDLGVEVDIATIAGLFKLYLRMLPNPLIKLDSSDLMQSDKRLIRYKLQNQDPIRYDLTYLILYFLNLVIGQSHINKMNLRNICIVFEPTLNVSSEILSYLLENFNEIFVHV